MSNDDSDHGKAAANASSGAESAVPGTSGGGGAENPHLEAFKRQVAGDPALQEQLAASTSDEHFAEQAVALGARSGHHFSVFEAIAHIAQGRAWSLAAADDDGDPETPGPSTQKDTSCTTSPGYTHQGSCSFWQC
ncbi:MAG TPA: Nif11-like leader peptide family natural product precursor [Xanthomonadales bacterium]|nr:Nif11-like leader peptide family natural product precursor [Xanthomonadales bacterium]